MKQETSIETPQEVKMSDFGARFLIAVAIEGWVKDQRLMLSSEVKDGY